MKRLIGVLIASALLVFPYPAAAQAPPVTDPVHLGVASALSKLQRYSTTNSLDDLRSAIYQMQSSLDIGTLTPSNFVADRRGLVSGWASILHAIEQAYDPKYNPNEHPGCPVPPNGQLPCSDPSAIQDADARAKYAQKLADFQASLARSYHEAEIEKVDRLAMTSLGAQLNQMRSLAPDSVGPDYAALDQILRQADLSSTRRASIDAMFYAQPAD